ncbi:MAG: DNA polymerase III subunit epsilon [Cellulomonas sp.]|nr:DNA polymerase III subunit epsilon [Cellulomonas sp.]
MTTSWSEGPLLGFDTETTGVDVDSDRIVTAALVRRDATSTSITTWLIDPGVPIPAEAAAIHGITTEHAREHGRPPRDALEEIAVELAEAFRTGVPVVAYNASFDLRLLDAELRRHRLPTLPDRLYQAARPVIDPLVLDRAEDRFRRGKRKLVDLCGFYRVIESGSLHSAFALSSSARTSGVGTSVNVATPSAVGSDSTPIWKNRTPSPSTTTLQPSRNGIGTYDTNPPEPSITSGRGKWG